MPETNDNRVNQSKSDKEIQTESLQIQDANELTKLNAMVTELENSVNQYRDQLLRKAAEFENYKKRTENDYASIIKYSTEELITKLLPVVDDFERSLKVIKKSKSESGDEQNKPAENDVFAKALELIYNKFVKILEAQGVRHFDVLGTPFDPQLHDALLQVPRSDVPPHTVVEEVEKGYRLHDKVLRHARVIVSADSIANEQNAVDSGTDDELK